MKTPIVYQWGRERVRREAGKPLFVPKGTPEGSDFTGKKHYFAKANYVSTRGNRFPLGCDMVRVIPEVYVERLDEIDGRIEQLSRERAALAEEAFRRGRKVKKEDCETLEDRRAQREAEAAAIGGAK